LVPAERRARPFDDLGGGRDVLAGNALDLGDAVPGPGGMIGNDAHRVGNRAGRRRLLLHRRAIAEVNENMSFMRLTMPSIWPVERSAAFCTGDLQRNVLGGARGLIGEVLHLRRDHA
jgi:hypothetical protein